MIKYPKIETLFMRDEKHKVIHKLRVTDFENIKNIGITEKINGTNAQIVLSINYETLDVKVRFCSRENEIEKKDIMYIADTCCKKLKLDEIAAWYYNNFALNQKELRVKDNAIEVRFFGEVYGAGINKGGIYSNEKDFRLFDIQIGNHFMNQEEVQLIAGNLGIKIAPVIYQGPIDYLLEYETLKTFLENFKTRINGEGGIGGLAEGIVIRSEPLLLNKYGERIIVKIKREDFVYEEKKESKLTLDELNPEDLDRRDGIYKED